MDGGDIASIDCKREEDGNIVVREEGPHNAGISGVVSFTRDGNGRACAVPILC